MAIKKSHTFCGLCQYLICYVFLNIRKAGNVDFPSFPATPLS